MINRANFVYWACQMKTSNFSMTRNHVIEHSWKAHHARRGIWNWLVGRKLVGRDTLGNSYWEFENKGGTPDPRREVFYDEKNLVKKVL